MILNLSSSHQLNDLLKSEKSVLVDFFADWCEPCKWLDVILEEVDNSMATSLSIVKIDSEKFQDLALEFNIKSVPVLLYFINNELVWRMNGFLSASELIDKISTISRGTGDE